MGYLIQYQYLNCIKQNTKMTSGIADRGIIDLTILWPIAACFVAFGTNEEIRNCRKSGVQLAFVYSRILSDVG